MSLLQRICRYVVNKANPTAPAIITDVQTSMGHVAPRTVMQLIKRNTSWAYAAADMNAKNIAAPPLRLYVLKPTAGQKTRFPCRAIKSKQFEFLQSKAALSRKINRAGEVEEVLDHPLLDLLDEVNEQMSEFDLMYLLGSSLEVTGNAYWLKVRNGLGVPIELWFLHPQFMRVKPDKNRFISVFEYGRKLGGMQKIDPKDIVFFKYVDVSNPVMGVGPLMKAILEVDLANSMNTHEFTLATRGGTPETILTYPAESILQPDERKRIEREYKQKFRGEGKGGKLFIASGGAKIDKFGFSPKEMNFLGGRKWTKEAILSIFGIPTAIMDIQSVSRANAEVANNQYQNRTIVPRLLMIEGKMNEDLVPEFDDNLILSFDNPVNEDKEFRLKEIENHLRNSYSTINEERAVDGLDPIDGGDELKPSNPNPFNGGLPEEPEKHINRKRRVPSLRMPAANFIPEPMTSDIQRYLRSVHEIIVNKATNDVLEQKSIDKASADDLVSSWFDFRLLDKELIKVTSPHIRASIVVAGERAIRSVAKDIKFDNTNPEVQKAMLKREGRIAEINRTIQKDVRRAVSTGLAEGESGFKIRRRIEVVMGIDPMERKRAVRIARTETIWAFNEGAVQGYKQSGVVEAKEWLASADDRTCEWCSSMDGTIVGLDTSFLDMGTDFTGTEGGILNNSYENTDHPPIHPLCRCTIIPVIHEI